MGNENLGGGTPHDVLLFIIPGVTSFMVIILHVHTCLWFLTNEGLGFETKLLIRVFSSLIQVMVPVYFWEGMN